MVSSKELLELDLCLPSGQHYARVFCRAIVVIVVEDGALCRQPQSVAAELQRVCHSGAKCCLDRPTIKARHSTHRRCSVAAKSSDAD